MQNRQCECFRCGRKFDPVRSDQMYCSKACRVRHYAEVRKAISLEKRPKYIIQMTTFYPKEQKTVTSYLKSISYGRIMVGAEFVSEFRLYEALHFRTKKETNEALKALKAIVPGNHGNRKFLIKKIGENIKEA